jgi:LacI family transcriptional regulator
MSAVMKSEENPSARPTLKTIAYLTGLGISTVSRALKDGPELSQETRARVKQIARQIGYRPNRAGVRLKTGKTNVITVVLNDHEEVGGFFSNFVYGISDGLAGTPYHLVVTPYSLSDPMEPIRYIVETGSADGVILSHTEPHDPRVRFLFEHGVSFATHGRTDMGITHPFHDFDNEAFAFEAVRILAEKGRRRVALLGPSPRLTYHRHTLIGFERGLEAFGLSGMSIGAVDVDSSIAELYATGCALADRGETIDGLVCSAVRSSLAIYFGMKCGGRVPGQDFDIVTKHTTDLLAMIAPEIFAIPEDFRAAGLGLARKVIASIAGAPATDLQFVAGLDDVAPPPPVHSALLSGSNGD